MPNGDQINPPNGHTILRPSTGLSLTIVGGIVTFAITSIVGANAALSSERDYADRTFARQDVLDVRLQSICARLDEILQQVNREPR